MDYNKDDVTIILQGVIYTEKILFNIITHYKKFAKIVVSTYFADNIKFIKKIIKYYPDVLFVNNDLTEYKKELIKRNAYHTNNYVNNYYYHIKTVENALKYVKTKYVIKTRVDFYFSDIENFIKDTIIHNDIVTCISAHVRGYYFCLDDKSRYHASDICYGGTFEIINNLSNNEINNFHVTLDYPEYRKWRYYVNDKLKEFNLTQHYIFQNSDNYSNFMSSIFNVYPINKNNSTYNFKDFTFIPDRIKTGKEYFIEGCS